MTRPLRFEGAELNLNFATSAKGSLRVEVQNPNGKPVPGFALDDCEELFGDSVSKKVSWTGEARLESLSGEPVRLRF